jgi:Fe-S-cluster containining protein
VRVTGDDYSRLSTQAEALVSFDGVRAHMRMVDGHCAALLVDAVSAELVCSAYATRPQVCRDLARGSGECAGEREMKAERPVLALRLARSSR